MGDPKDTIQIGVYIPGISQLLDAACVDIFATMSRKYLQTVDFIAPAPIIDMSQDIQIHWIGTAAPGTTVETTGNAFIKLSHNIESPEVQPGKLDIILIPGPDPTIQWGEDVLDFLRGHAKNEGTDVLSVCTGLMVCAQAGLIKGKTVCGPRGLQNMFKDYGANLVGHKYRWWRDGNFWSSGGVTNGNDLVAHYIRTSGRFALPPGEFAIAGCEVGDRPQEYEKSMAAFGLGMLWQVVKAYLGMGKPQKKLKSNSS